jgi:hypothetical protein
MATGASYNGNECDPDTQFLTNVDFCPQKAGPSFVELNVTETDRTFSITANAAATCASAETVAHLGHAGAKRSRSIIRTTAPGDRDTFAFDGSAGEKIVVALEKEGTAGHIGDAAVLRVPAPGDTTLDEVSGPLPLEVELPATGKVQVVIEEPASSKTDALVEGFRGHYLLSVTPDGGADDLLLEPRPDVEP